MKTTFQSPDVFSLDQNSSVEAYDDSATSGAITQAQRIKICVLLGLGAIHIAVTLLTVVPGYLSIDESFYHWMTKSFHDTGSLALWNGYEKYPSLELVHPYVNLNSGYLFPPHPYLFPVLASPLYHLFGFRGLFMTNAVAFLGVVILCFFTAQRLFRDRDVALNSCLILVAATFVWEYSQAAWPHCVSMFFVSAAFFLFVCAYEQTDRAKGSFYALASGLVAGFAMGIRLDTVLVVPALVLPFLFSRPWRPKEVAMVAVGLLPGATVLALTNMAKFGSLSLFSYGQEGLSVYNRPTAPSLDMMAVGLCVLSLSWILTRSWVRERHGYRYILIGVIATGTALAIWVLSGALQPIEKITEYSLVSLVDSRLLDPSIVFPPMARSAGGGVVYMGSHKKALLQNLPFLAVLIVPIGQMVRGSRHASFLAILFVIPLTVIVYFSYAFLAGEGGGGLCLNQRYLLTGIPSLCILAAYAIRYVTSSCEPRSLLITAIPLCIATAGVYLLLTGVQGHSIDQLEFPILSVPLLIALALAVCAIVALSRCVAKSRIVRVMVWSLLVVAFTWSGLVAFLHDYPGHQLGRKAFYDFGQNLLRVVPPNSVFLAGPGFFTGAIALIEKPGVQIAYPARDRFTDLPGLLEFQLASGERAFGVFRNQLWSELQQGPLKSFRITPVLTYHDYFVAEIGVR